VRHWIFFILIVLHPALGYPATYYVAEAGSNANNGTSTGTAWLTISHAIRNSTCGDVVNVGGGVYAERVEIADRDCTSGAKFTLQRYQNEVPVVNRHPLVVNNSEWIVVDGFIQQGSPGAGVFVHTGSKNIVLKNLEARNNATNGILVRSNGVPIDGITIEDSRVHDNRIGISVGTDRGNRDISNVTIRRVESYLNGILNGGSAGGDGLGISNTDGFIVEDSIFRHDRWEDGIDLKTGSVNGIIRRNQVFGNRAGGIWANVAHSNNPGPYNGGFGHVIEDNLVYDNGGPQLAIMSQELGSGTTFYMQNNRLRALPGANDVIRIFRGHTVVIRNNTLINGNRSITLRCARNIVVENNIGINAAAESFFITGTSHPCNGFANGLITERNNNWWKSTGGHIIRWSDGTRYTAAQLSAYRSASGQGSGTVSIDPSLADVGSLNFALRLGSRMIDAGIANSLLRDYSGLTRPQGASHDIGAHEFRSAPR
jgi:hypothetical protein